MAELVDAQVSGTCAARRGGSSPLPGTIQFCTNSNLVILYVFFKVRGVWIKVRE